MNLRESIAGEPGMPDPLEGREDFLWASAFVSGYGEAVGLELGVGTDGRTFRLHNTTNDTRNPAPILRDHRTTAGVRSAMLAALKNMENWVPESDGWGPNPWDDGRGDDVQRQRTQPEDS